MTRLAIKVPIVTDGAGRTKSTTVAGLLVLSMCLCWVAGARAQMPPPVADDDQVALFAAFCLDAFPDAAALDRVAASRKAVAMTPDELKALLRDDPGRGWLVRTQQALHGITVELPPYVTCAVRRMTPSGPSGAKNYMAAVNKYIAAKNGKLINLPPQRSAQNGTDISVYAHGMVDADGLQRETFAVILTNFNFQAPEPWSVDAGSGVGVEVRLVHYLATQ